jgi:ATP-dependent RNA helicase RhlE
VRVEVTPPATTVGSIDQRVILAGSKQKRDELNRLLADPALSRVIIFSRTKHGADRVAKNLAIDGFAAAAIHGNKSQNARQAALKGFASGNVRILVATDIAARGIDVPGITHVVNYELPDDAENYVHRIGRTGRNGASGIAITLCDGTERAKLREVERLIRRTLPVSGEIRQPASSSAGDAAEATAAGSRSRVAPGRPGGERASGKAGRHFSGAKKATIAGGRAQPAGGEAAGKPAGAKTVKPRWSKGRRDAALSRTAGPARMQVRAGR